MKKTIFLFFFLIGISSFTLKSQVNNVDFESGHFNHWNGSYNLSSSLNCGTSTPNPLTNGGIDSVGNNPAQQIVSSGFDQLVKTVNLPVNSPFGGSYSVRLGDTLNGCGTSQLDYVISTVSAANYNISICYAVVLYDTGYSFNDAPKFIFQVETGIGYCILCDTLTAGNMATDTSFHQADLNKVGLYYTSWKKVCLNLLPYIGQGVVINFISSDCNNKTHLGYAYIDCVLNTCNNVTTDINAINTFSNNIVLYPNPANNYFNLTVKNLVNDAFEITLYDMKGAVLLKDNFTSLPGKTTQTYKTDGLEKGVYFISIKDKQHRTIQKKLIIN
ncbi:MAG: T9SS type A sorting domain-containing protein [Bacteroidia bacterium]